jgi:hypothetical protein
MAAPIPRVHSCNELSFTSFRTSLFCVSSPVVERMNVIRLCVADTNKLACHDRSKPKGECYNHRRYDDRESQNKVSEEVHYWKISRRYPLLNRLAKSKLRGCLACSRMRKAAESYACQTTI